MAAGPSAGMIESAPMRGLMTNQTMAQTAKSFSSDFRKLMRLSIPNRRLRP